MPPQETHLVPCSFFDFDNMRATNHCTMLHFSCSHGTQDYVHTRPHLLHFFLYSDNSHFSCRPDTDHVQFCVFVYLLMAVTCLAHHLCTESICSLLCNIHFTCSGCLLSSAALLSIKSDISILSTSKLVEAGSIMNFIHLQDKIVTQ